MQMLPSHSIINFELQILSNLCKKRVYKAQTMHFVFFLLSEQENKLFPTKKSKINQTLTFQVDFRKKGTREFDALIGM